MQSVFEMSDNNRKVNRDFMLKITTYYSKQFIEISNLKSYCPLPMKLWKPLSPGVRFRIRTVQDSCKKGVS